MELTKEHFLKIYGDYLEPNTDINQKNVVFKCPFHADSNPSYAVSTDVTHPVGHCWSCGVKHSWVNFYMQTRNVDYKTALKELDMFEENYVKQPSYVHPHPEQLIIKQKNKKVEIDYSDYCIKICNETILNDKFYEFYGKKLYKLRGITYDTAVACGIGYDKDKGWVFPIIRFSDNKVVGYEVRQKEFKKFSNGSKCFKAEHTPSCLSVVWKGWDSKRAVVAEGYADSYFMYQYLHEKAQKSAHSDLGYVQETILTPSNGVKTIPELVKSNELWNKFDEVLFVLDEDSASRPITEELKQLTREHGNNFKFFTDLKEGQDWEEKYKELLKNNT